MCCVQRARARVSSAQLSSQNEPRRGMHAPAAAAVVDPDLLAGGLARLRARSVGRRVLKSGRVGHGGGVGGVRAEVERAADGGCGAGARARKRRVVGIPSVGERRVRLVDGADVRGCASGRAGVRA
jgi:hypothetical protein